MVPPHRTTTDAALSSLNDNFEDAFLSVQDVRYPLLDLHWRISKGKGP